MMDRRRALMGKKKGRLPVEFQEVTYVGVSNKTSTSSSMIDLNYSPTTGPKAIFSWAADGGSRDIFSLDSTTTAPAFRLYTASNNIYYKWGSSTNTSGMTGMASWTWYDIEAGLSFKVNGVVKATKTATDWSGNTKTVKLFYGQSSYAQCRLKEFKLFDGETLVRDLVPCRRKLDSRYGFYCLITNEFYTNAGAANILTGGADVN